jgi:hypothetical protein
VEESTRTQAQTQALGVYLSAQQSRIVQLAARVDTARRELDELTSRSRELASGLSAMESQLLRVADPAERVALENASQGMKAEQQSVAFQEQQVRAREAELSQALQVENSRWADLISRLEQLIRR